MIRSIQFKTPANVVVEWFSTVTALASHTEPIAFKPGLNLVVGPNASGKSTLLRILAQRFACYQGGIQKLTHFYMKDAGIVWKTQRDGCEYRVGSVIDHDGGPVTYFNPDATVGLLGGQFDDDFFLEGVFNVRRRSLSSGMAQLEQMDRVLAPLLGCPWPEPLDLSRIKCAEAIDFFKGQPHEGEPVTGCVILDEPARSVDLAKRPRFWWHLAMKAQQGAGQIIAASHDPIAFMLPLDHLGIHLIDLSGGEFYQQVTTSLEQLIVSR